MWGVTRVSAKTTAALCAWKCSRARQEGDEGPHPESPCSPEGGARACSLNIQPKQPLPRFPIVTTQPLTSVRAPLFAVLSSMGTPKGFHGEDRGKKRQPDVGVSSPSTKRRTRTQRPFAVLRLRGAHFQGS